MKNANNKMGRTFEVKAPRVVKPIANGAYTGTIIAIKYRGPQQEIKSDYDYADMTIQVNGLPDTTIDYSLPSKDLTPTTGFGKFIALFQPFKVGDKIDPETALKNKAVQFMVMNVPGKTDPTTMYPRVVRGSVFPMGMNAAAPAAA